MVLAVILSIPVFVDVIRMGYATRILVMACMLMVLFYLFTLNNLIKKLIVRDNEIIIRGLFGSTRIPVDEVKACRRSNDGHQAVHHHLVKEKHLYTQ